MMVIDLPHWSTGIYDIFSAQFCPRSIFRAASASLANSSCPSALSTCNQWSVMSVTSVPLITCIQGVRSVIQLSGPSQ